MKKQRSFGSSLDRSRSRDNISPALFDASNGSVVARENRFKPFIDSDVTMTLARIVEPKAKDHFSHASSSTSKPSVHADRGSMSAS